MGLPEALTFYLAKRPHQSRRALLIAAAFSVVCAALLAAFTVPFLPVLSGGDADLAHITLLATLIAVPQLTFSLLRGVAAGQQLWYRIAVERTIGAVVRLAMLIALAVADKLTVQAAVLIICLTPFVSGLVYLPILWRKPVPVVDATTPPLMRALLSYGTRTWVGSIAGILLAKLSVLLFTPLSDPTQLGLYVVGVTISDLPILLSLAVKDALFGVNARSKDTEQFTMVCRLCLLLTVVGSLAISVSLPLWIAFVFGSEFSAAVPTTWILMGCAVANVPTFILAAGIGAWGRPGIRSIGLLITLVIDVVCFVALVPNHGASGAASANLISATFGAVFSLIGTGRVIGVPISAFIVPRASDVRFLQRQTSPLLRALRLTR